MLCHWCKCEIANGARFVVAHDPQNADDHGSHYHPACLDEEAHQALKAVLTFQRTVTFDRRPARRP